MPKKTKKEETAQADETPATEPEEESGKTFEVVKNGEVIRTYTEGIHGKAAGALAKQFADKFKADQIRKS